MPRSEYGHQRKEDKAGSLFWRWLLVIVMLVWGLSICAWNSSRLGEQLNHEAALGAPLFELGGRVWYWPWQIIVWGEKFEGHRLIDSVVNQTYLLAVGLPVVILLLCIYFQNMALKGRDDLHGSAHWATRKDIRRMGYLDSKGVYVGGWWDEKKRQQFYLRHDGPEHILCFAPTRSGKGVGLILPTLLSWPHSSVVLDIKGENFALTSGYLASRGHKTLRFDPSDAEGTSAAFNPLAEVRLDSVMAIPDMQQIAKVIMDPDGKGLDSYWEKAADGFFSGALLHCLIKTKYEEGRDASLYDVAVMLEDPKRPVADLFQEMLDMDHASILLELFPKSMVKEIAEATHVFIASAARGMLSKAEQEMSGVVNTATANLSLYKDPVVAMNISRCDFTLNDLMNHKVPLNLYLVISPADIDRLRPLLRVVVGQMLGRLTRVMEFEDGASKAGYKHRLLMMLDEFTSLGKLAIIERGIAYMAGYGVKGYFIVQDTTQLRQAYGQDNALMANCHVRIAYAPNVPETAEYLSKMVGTTTVVDKKKSISRGGGRGGGSTSTNIAETSRPLLTPDECMRLPGLSKDAAGKPVAGDMLIFTAGHPPIYGRQILYFRDPTFSKRARVKAPGVTEGYNRGLSHSIYFNMPHGFGQGPAPAASPAATEQANDLAAEYKEYLQEGEGNV